MSADRRVSARVSGRVQGVGFRYFCRGLAERSGLSGWVKNMPNGEVELEAQGPQESVGKFLEEVKKAFPGARVENLKTDERPPEPGAQGFEILP